MAWIAEGEGEGQGDGSIYKSADGRWRAVVDLGWVDGKRQRKYVSGAAQADVLSKLKKVQREAEEGVVADDGVAVGQFLQRWTEVNLPGSGSGATLDDYVHTNRLLLAPALGHKRLAHLTVAEVDAFLATKRTAGYKPNSVRIMRAILRRALGQAEREGLVPRNVAALSQPPRLPHDPRLNPARIEISHPKSRRSRRVLYLTEAVVALLDARAAAQEVERRTAGDL